MTAEETKNDTPEQPGTHEPFPPNEHTEVPEVSTIGSSAETTVSDGPICDATSTVSNLSDLK